MSTRPELGWRQYRRMRQEILGADDTCIWCGHPGADATDHVVPVSRGGARLDPGNLGPIHGVGGCPHCGRQCNTEKGDQLLTEVNRLVTSRDWYRSLPS